MSLRATKIVLCLAFAAVLAVNLFSLRLGLTDGQRLGTCGVLIAICVGLIVYVRKLRRGLPPPARRGRASGRSGSR